MDGRQSSERTGVGHPVLSVVHISDLANVPLVRLVRRYLASHCIPLVLHDGEPQWLIADHIDKYALDGLLNGVVERVERH